MTAWTVVKVGGSLYDWTALGPRLRAWLDNLDARNILLVPGGGPAANVIRALDQTHRLGEETSHWLAIAALSLNARFLQTLVPDAVVVSDPRSSLASASGYDTFIVDPLPFFQADDKSSQRLPHVWEVTSDSLAVRVAIAIRANELILLKSLKWEGDDWRAASRAGVVDGHFATALAQAPRALRVRILNLRDAP